MIKKLIPEGHTHARIKKPFLVYMIFNWEPSFLKRNMEKWKKWKRGERWACGMEED